MVTFIRHYSNKEHEVNVTLFAFPVMYEEDKKKQIFSIALGDVRKHFQTAPSNNL